MKLLNVGPPLIISSCSLWLQAMNGAELIALTITAALYGIISGQFLVYLRRNYRDRRALKVMVGFL